MPEVGELAHSGFLARKQANFSGENCHTWLKKEILCHSAFTQSALQS